MFDKISYECEKYFGKNDAYVFFMISFKLIIIAKKSTSKIRNKKSVKKTFIKIKLKS